MHLFENTHLFSRTAKYLRFQRYYSVNIPEQSTRNFQALLKRLRERNGLPEIEKAAYGKEILSPDEKTFFQYWLREVVPKFTAIHGSKSFSYLQKLGYMMPVADRKRQKAYVGNNNTAVNCRQEFHYFVLGIGDNHSLPSFLGHDVGMVKIDFSQMTKEDKQQFQGMFISHHTDLRNRPVVVYGDTLVKVHTDYKGQSKETTFVRADGTELKETVRYESDDIFCAIPDIDFIFHALGLRFIEYLRFIGGDFQQSQLKNREVKTTAAAFHSLFPSEDFPELKIPIKKIPLDAPYVKLVPFDPKSLKYRDELHQACEKLDVEKCRKALEKAPIDCLDATDQTVLQTLLNTYDVSFKVVKDGYQRFLEILDLLLEYGADMNLPFKPNNQFMDGMSGYTLINRVVKKHQSAVVERLMRGSANPNCASIRTFPIIDQLTIEYFLSPFVSDFSHFLKFYPFYRFSFAPTAIIQDLFTYIRCHPDQQEPKESFRKIITECDPNVPCLTFESTTLLMRAAIDGNDSIVDILLQHPSLQINHVIQTINGKVSEFEGWTALDFAYEHNQVTTIKKLEAAGAIRKKQDHQQVKVRDIASAACVTAVVKGKSYVLLVRKGNSLDEPHHHYLFPGGLFDETDKDLEFTAKRETLEETGVSLEGSQIKVILDFEDINEGRYLKRGFYHFHLGDLTKVPACLIRDDIASSNWVAIDELEHKLVDGCSFYQVGEIPLRFDNAIMLASVLNKTMLHPEIIVHNQRLLFCLDSIGEFFVLGLRSLNPGQLNIDYRYFLELSKKVPAGALRKSMEEFALQLSDSVDKTILRECLVSMIRNLITSARCHPDDLKWVRTLSNKRQGTISILLAACECEDEALVHELLSLGACPNQYALLPGGQIMTPLMLVIMREKYHLAKLMIEQYGAHISVRDPRLSPLVASCRNEIVSLDFIQYLLGRMLIINDADIGSSILELIRGGHEEIIRTLYASYPVPLNKKYADIQEFPQYQFPLICAIQSRKPSMVQLIVTLGADPQTYISKDTHFRWIVFQTKIQIKKEISLTLNNEELHGFLKAQLLELQKIKNFIDDLTPDSEWTDPDDVTKYINSL